MEANTSGSMWLHSGHILRIELICLIEKKKKTGPSFWPVHWKEELEVN